MAQLGLCFVYPAPEIHPGYVTDAAKKCEAMGLDSFWIIDRITYDNLEPLCVLASASAVTERVRLGTSVLLPALRQPALLAKMVATLDFLSAGRITLGVGAGSREADFAAVGVPFEHRGSRLEEGIRLMKRLWSEERVTHRGRFFQVQDLAVGPRPLQSPHPPIWMGGGAEAVLRRVARLADGFICGSSGIFGFSSVWEKIATFARSAGRDPDRIAKAGLTFMAIDENRRRAVDACSAYLTRYYGKVRVDVEKNYLVGPAGFCAERIQAMLQAGVENLIIGPAVADPRQLDLLGEKVLPLLRHGS